MPDLAQAALLAFDIDGTLTDATTWWGGPELGWLQRYSVRDGEALLRIKKRIPVVPLSSGTGSHGRPRNGDPLGGHVRQDRLTRGDL